MKPRSSSLYFYSGNNDPHCKILQLDITLAKETKEKDLIVLVHTATVISILKDRTLKTVAKSYLTLPVTVNMLAKLINLTQTTNL